MKKNFIYALMSAIALTSAVGFTACSSSDEVAQDNTNPTYDGKNVRTDFAFSVTKASKGATRMAAADVQETTTNSFLGIKEMFLLPFSGVPGTATTTNAASFYLGDLTTADINNNVIGRDGTTSSKVYSLTLPIHTNNFLFYGVANNSGTNFAKGSVTRIGLNVPTTSDPSAEVAINGIGFRLDKISHTLGDDSLLIVKYLNKIANTPNWAGTVTQSATDNTYKALSDLYQKFTDNNHQPRAGSAEGVTRTVLDLYRSAKKINAESSVEAIQTIANAICTKIKTPEGGVIVNIDETNTDPNNWTATIAGLHDTSFPNALGLPMGAAQLVWTSTGFNYNETPLNFGPSSDSKKVEIYRYPSELIYFDNSPLRATEQYRAASDYPTSAANWDNAASTGITGNNGFDLTIWNKDEVTPGTRAVAMTNNVNYGVALLQTNVKLGAITSGHTGFEDNRGVVLGTNLDTDNQTDIDATAFKVTGILIGGQPRQVTWDMTNPDDAFDFVIYDKAVAFGDNTLSTSNFANNNYTLVLDNYASGNDDDQKKVRIALEIKNGNQDFYGCNGLIPANSTFYLVGELDPASPSTTSTEPAYHNSYRLTKEDIKRVFKQDYKTIVNMTISEDALKGAYNTIPDLRATEIVFGLSVDLKWEAGMIFKLEF